MNASPQPSDPPIPAAAWQPEWVLLFRLTAFLTVAWIIVLAVMVFTASNPIQVSEAQLRASDAVVTGRREGEFRLRVDRIWKGTVKEGLILVVNLDLSRIPEEKPFIVPLTRFRDGWKVTTLGDHQPRQVLVYPETLDVRDEVRRILRK